MCEDLETMRDDPVGMLTKIELQCTEYFDFMDSQPDALVRKMLKILEKVSNCCFVFDCSRFINFHSKF